MKTVQDHIQTSKSPSIKGRTVVKSFPSTPSQLEIWVQCYLVGSEASMAYNESYSQMLYGEVNVGFFKEAVEIVVAKHEGTRAVFSKDGMVVNILESLEVPFNFIDISGFSEEGKKEFIEKSVVKPGYTEFDLEHGPLLSCELIKISDQEFRYIQTGHHIIFDGWSSVLLFSHIGLVYAQLCEGKEVFLPQLHNMSDYIDKLKQLSSSEESKEIRKYWIAKLSQPIPSFNLPIDFERPAIRDLRAKQLKINASKGLLVQAKKFAIKNKVSLHLLLMSIYELFLAQWTKSDDIMIGMPRAGQPVLDSINMIGHSVFLLPVRSKINFELTFEEYLEVRRKNFVDVLKFGTITFSELIQGLELKRDMSRIPLVPVTFNNSIGVEKRIKFGHLENILVSNPKSYGNFEILLDMLGPIYNPTFEWTYNQSLFKDETILNAAKKYDQLIKFLIENPTTKLTSIQRLMDVDQRLMNTEELSQIQGSDLKPNGALTQTKKELPLAVEMFQNTAAIFSDKIAISTNGKSITYRVMNEQSNQLASLLVAKGVKPGDYVGIYLERSNSMVIAIMAILKAGAAYLPIDVEIPAERTIYMLRNSNAKFYFTDQPIFKNGELKDNRIDMEEALQDCAAYTNENKPVETTLDNPMYIIYTSGSTGNPKGVVLTHKNLNYLIKEPITGLNYHPHDVLLGVTSVSFDMATFEVLLPYLFGATVYMLDKYQRKDPKYVLEVMDSVQATKLFATPTHWQMMINSGWEKPMPGLSAICAGEPLKKILVDKLAPLVGEIFNMYGPTETTVFTNLKKIDPTESKIGIGKAVSGTTIYIVDQNGGLINQPNFSGEIWIGSDGVGMGYLKMDELTAEKFIKNPFEDQPERLFRSGDLGYKLPNGDIQCEGRLDYQVKIRGHRIELGEIEQRILQCEGVANVVVDTTELEGFVSLVAFISLKDRLSNDMNSQDFIDSIKKELAIGLPDYMIPSELQIVDEFKTTTSGKIDRRHLKESYVKKDLNTSPKTAPKDEYNPIEKRVYTVWSSVLSTKNLNLDSDFFMSGGHSLLGVKLISLLEKEFNISLTLLTLFQYPTIRSLSAYIAKLTNDSSSDSLVLIKKGKSNKVLCFVHGVGLNPIEVKSIVENMGDEYTIYGLQSPAISGNAEPLHTIPEMATFYLKELEKINIEGAYNLIGNSIGGLIVYEMAHQLKASNKQVGFLGMIDTIALCYYEAPKTFQGRLLKSLKKLKFEFEFLIDDLPYYLNHRARYLGEKWRQFKSNGKEYHDLASRIHEIEMINRKAWESYKIEPLAIDLTLFLAAKKTFYLEDFETLGWSKYTKNVERCIMPGDHANMLKPPHGKGFIQVLQAKLKQNQIQRF